MKIRGTKGLTEKELEEKFENFIFNLDEYIEHLVDKASKQGFNLNYSLKSLTDLEAYLSKNNVDKDSDDVNDAAAYFGEVVRKNFGGSWKCSLDMEGNSMYYGKPVLSGYTESPDLELSPFETVLFYILKPKENHFLSIIENDIDPDGINLTEFPAEVE
ncbi:hypothetical protein SAMN06265348_101153 [Pedobacter westerhofensis]|uniref:Uncharacterized protein n=1 Tax=Pedobacter westerhofensis TaxID=425512 RepID=A0A521AGB8_9SPHI|nr:hypothetical protein [Pedobacter westerhofensis]SMO33750.1 hypothetical protein SAMN06265348_101153 [Pedobacter westerhofensis]